MRRMQFFKKIKEICQKKEEIFGMRFFLLNQNDVRFDEKHKFFVLFSGLSSVKFYLTLLIYS